MKTRLLSLLVFAGVGAHAGEVGRPVERIALPALAGDLLVCVWDDAADDWVGEFLPYNASGSLQFQIPELGKWYWIGLWDRANGRYVFGKWVGHF